MLERPLSHYWTSPLKISQLKGVIRYVNYVLKYEIFCFWDYYILLSKLQKIIRMAGEVLYVCWRSTYAGEALYVYGWQILSDFTYAGEVLYVCWRFTYAGEVLYVSWRFTYAGDFTYAGATWFLGKMRTCMGLL